LGRSFGLFQVENGQYSLGQSLLLPWFDMGTGLLRRQNDRNCPAVLVGNRHQSTGSVWHTLAQGLTMRRVRVCVYGGADLQGTPTKFISALPYRILDSMPAVIVTGGFLHSNKKPKAVSPDVVALEGGRRYANEHGIDLKDCYQAWIPEPSLDSRPEIEGAVRMNETDCITV